MHCPQSAAKMYGMNLGRYHAGLAAAVAILIGALPCRAELRSVRTVAITGQQAPGSANPIFTGFGFGTSGEVIDDEGHVVFLADISPIIDGPPTSSDPDGGPVLGAANRAIWSERGGNGLYAVVFENTLAVGTTGDVRYECLHCDSYHVGRGGHVAARLDLTGADVIPFVNNEGVWAEQAGPGLSKIAWAGETAPGTVPPVLFAGSSGSADDQSNFGVWSINRHGKMAFTSGLSPPDDVVSVGGGFWTNAWSDDVTAVTGLGVPTGLPGNVRFRGLSPNRVLDDGRILVYGHVEGENITPDNDFGYWLAQPGPIFRPLVRDGDPASRVPVAPDDPQGEFFFTSVTAYVTLNDHLVVYGFASQRDSNRTVTGLWSDAGGQGLLPVVLQGRPVPGQALWPGLFRTLEVNEAGTAAFAAAVNGSDVDVSNDQGLWATDPEGRLRLVAREGQLAPGTVGDVRFGWYFFPTSHDSLFYNAALNNVGHVAFLAPIMGIDVPPRLGNWTLGNVGIWAEDTSGVLQLLVRTHDTIEVAPGDVRTISYLEMMPGGGAGSASSFNDLGQLTFRAHFTDGSHGIFVSNAVAIPEPAAALIVATTLGCLVLCRVSRTLRSRGQPCLN